MIIKHKYQILMMSLSFLTLFISHNKNSDFGISWLLTSILSATFAAMEDIRKS
jgi:hypothetical protein